MPYPAQIALSQALEAWAEITSRRYRPSRERQYQQMIRDMRLVSAK